MAMALASCSCVILNAVGLTMLVGSFADRRTRLVRSYSEVVLRWEESGRARLANASMNVTVRWISGGTGRNTTKTMVASMDAEQRPFHDVEHGDGLVAYDPLAFAATFDFRSYYPGGDDAAEGADWESLPERGEAAHVAFELIVRSDNGSASTLVTRPVALVYDQVVQPRTPAPDNKCRKEQQGTWRDRQCHVVKRLKSVCVQVQLGESHTWRAYSRAPVGATGKRSRRKPAEPQETYGCDMTNSWNPASYVVDPCWGSDRWTEKCPPELRQRHSVKVIVRGADDPYIGAEELTGNSLDFGLSSKSLRANAMVMMVIGGLLCLVPVIRVIVLVGRKKTEETHSLRNFREDRSGCAAGVYGNSVV